MKDADLFAEGSIYYYENTTNSKRDYDNNDLNHDFLVSRPVFVLPENRTPFDLFSVNVLSITSSTNRVGIPINIDGEKKGKILPYAIYSVHKEYLTTYMGRASDDIIQEVLEAVDYHMKRTDKIPAYIQEYENKKKETKEKIGCLSLKEKILYSFLHNRMLYREECYVTQEEIFNAYQKFAKDAPYERLTDFSRGMNKLIHEFEVPVNYQVKKDSRVYYGMSLKENVHKIHIEKPENDKKSNKRNVDIPLKYTAKPNTGVENDSLILTLSERSAKLYNRLDNIQKIGNYRKSISDMDVGVFPTEELPIIKQMIENDVEKRKAKVLRLLDAGESPMNLNSINQFMLWNCTNREILDHIHERHLKKGGIDRIRKCLRNNVKHYFTRLKMN